MKTRAALALLMTVIGFGAVHLNCSAQTSTEQLYSPLETSNLIDATVDSGGSETIVKPATIGDLPVQLVAGVGGRLTVTSPGLELLALDIDGDVTCKVVSLSENSRSTGSQISCQVVQDSVSVDIPPATFENELYATVVEVRSRTTETRVALAGLFVTGENFSITLGVLNDYLGKQPISAFFDGSIDAAIGVDASKITVPGKDRDCGCKLQFLNTYSNYPITSIGTRKEFERVCKPHDKIECRSSVRHFYSVDDLSCVWVASGGYCGTGGSCQTGRCEIAQAKKVMKRPCKAAIDNKCETDTFNRIEGGFIDVDLVDCRRKVSAKIGPECETIYRTGSSGDPAKDWTTEKPHWLGDPVEVSFTCSGVAVGGTPGFKIGEAGRDSCRTKQLASDDVADCSQFDKSCVFSSVTVPGVGLNEACITLKATDPKPGFSSSCEGRPVIGPQ